ncbi:hypothetical protein CPB83DRAFT_846152 [Crepidotus variabilis]|uniref:Uncharacterized protein n=1 Tax=Crepidotus variabilis TaxID=179855 RepID=A0A9P6EQW6_9AGAR|nr:hypothetical protein CPB83DRAFT_846152 [Crepidotus variabilis]
MRKLGPTHSGTLNALIYPSAMRLVILAWPFPRALQVSPHYGSRAAQTRVQFTASFPDKIRSVAPHIKILFV